MGEKPLSKELQHARSGEVRDWTVKRMKQDPTFEPRALGMIVTKSQTQHASRIAIRKERIMNAVLIVGITTLTLFIPAVVNAQEERPMPRSETSKAKLVKAGYVKTNGVNYYYELHGKGDPLLLLHGGLGLVDMFGPVLLILARDRLVIAIDLQGHGHTSLGDRSISPVDMGDDMAVIVKALGYQRVDALGYSLGGGVALRFAVQHPDMVRRLALVSTPFAQNGFYPEMLPMQAQVSAAMLEQMKQTPMYQSYVAVAPNPNDFPKLLDRMGEYMRKAFDWLGDSKSSPCPSCWSTATVT
jgi:esterase/lipase